MPEIEVKYKLLKLEGKNDFWVYEWIGGVYFLYAPWVVLWCIFYFDLLFWRGLIVQVSDREDMFSVSISSSVYNKYAVHKTFLSHRNRDRNTIQRVSNPLDFEI